MRQLKLDASLNRLDPHHYDPAFWTKQEAEEVSAFLLGLPRTRKPNSMNSSSFIKRLSMPSWNDYGTKRGYKPDASNPVIEDMLLDSAPQIAKNLAITLSLLAAKPVNYLAPVGYENEKDHIGWHQHEEDRTRDARVFIASFLETRTFGLREICPECRVCAECNEAACDGYEHKCIECAAAKKHRKTCPITNNRKNWILLQPAHGSLITLPSDCNWTHEHAVLDDTTPKGLRISINTKCLPINETLEEFIARMERPTKVVPRFVLSAEAAGPRVYDCHKGKKYPADGVYVGCKTTAYRSTTVLREGTIYGNGKNPFKGHYPLAAKNSAEFRVYAEKKMQDPAFRTQAIAELRGRDLLCWHKPDDPDCHARVWLEIVNRPEFANTAVTP